MEIWDTSMKTEDLILKKTVKKNYKSNTLLGATEEDVNAVGYYKNNNSGGFRGNHEYRSNSNWGNPQRGGRDHRGGRGGNNKSQRGGKLNPIFLQGVFCEFCGKEGHREEKL